MDINSRENKVEISGFGPFGANPQGFAPPDSTYHLGTGEDVEFQVENGWTHILHAPPFLLSVFDQELRYPTQVALAMEAGFVAQDGWDGWIRLLRKPTQTNPSPRVPTGLLSALIRLCGKFGFTYRIHDSRNKPAGDVPEMVTIPLRDYQEAAVEAALKAGRGVLDMPPRSGKTRTMAEIHRRLALPTAWLAPTTRIVTQTAEVLAGFFGENYAFTLVGSKDWKAASRKKIVVCTAATAGNLPADFWKSRQVVVVDEWHHAAAKTYREILDHCEHVYYRFGMTGTFYRSGLDELAMHALLSNAVYKITSRELLARGFLIPVKVVFIPVLGHVRGCGTGFQTGHGKAGIHEHTYRQSMVAHVAHYLQSTGRRVLVLVGTKKQGRDLETVIRTLVPRAPDGCQRKSVEFICHDTPKTIQGEILESFVAGREVKVLIGTSIVGEGVDLPTTDSLVYAKGEKAEVTLVQNAYRVATAAEGKDSAIIVDFADRHHRKLLQHALERLRIYHEEPSFEVKVLQDPQEFPQWLQAQGKKLDQNLWNGVI
jgi:superfamily II DNA or RNA helicase